MDLLDEDAAAWRSCALVPVYVVAHQGPDLLVSEVQELLEGHEARSDRWQDIHLSRHKLVQHGDAGDADLVDGHHGVVLSRLLLLLLLLICVLHL